MYNFSIIKHTGEKVTIITDTFEKGEMSQFNTSFLDRMELLSKTYKKISSSNSGL